MSGAVGVAQRGLPVRSVSVFQQCRALAMIVVLFIITMVAHWDHIAPKPRVLRRPRPPTYFRTQKQDVHIRRPLNYTVRSSLVGALDHACRAPMADTTRQRLLERLPFVCSGGALCEWLASGGGVRQLVVTIAVLPDQQELLSTFASSAVALSTPTLALVVGGAQAVVAARAALSHEHMMVMALGVLAPGNDGQVSTSLRKWVALQSFST